VSWCMFVDLRPLFHMGSRSLNFHGRNIGTSFSSLIEIRFSFETLAKINLLSAQMSHRSRLPGAPTKHFFLFTLLQICQCLRIASFTATQLPGPNYHCHEVSHLATFSSPFLCFHCSASRKKRLSSENEVPNGMQQIQSCLQLPQGLYVLKNILLFGWILALGL
jgi:hypothetical protein